MAQPTAQPKFKVLKALGKGSYGTVYKVQRLADGVVYAMKETDLGRMGPKERADAVNEIRVLGSMSHPNVVRHHETFLSSSNKLCIVMEYAPAGDLSTFIKAAAASKMPLPEATIWQIFLQLCQGMQAIHETCVIHRDIKPANIFMCPDNVVKVGDLGVAKALAKAHYAQTTIGTPVFMAPEVWRGLRYAYASDLWSLGGVLYEMMTYRLPFEARSLNELKNKIILGTYQPLVPGSPYSSDLVTMCHALLNKDPRKRPTCAAILNSAEAANWLHTIPESVQLPLPPLDAGVGVAPPMLDGPGVGSAAQLLPTIHIPRDIRQLPNHLPKPSYDSGHSTQQQQQVATRAMLVGQPGSSNSPRQYQGLSPAAAAAMAAAAAAAAGIRGRNRSGPGAIPGAGGNIRPPSPGSQQRNPSPKVFDPSSRAAGAAGGGGILGVQRGAAANAAGSNAAAAAAARLSPYPVARGVLDRGSGGGGLAAGQQRAGGVTPNRLPPGGFKSPSAQGFGGMMAAAQKMPAAVAGYHAAGRVPSGGGRAPGIAAGALMGAGAVAAAGGAQAAAASAGNWPASRAAAAIAARQQAMARRQIY